MDASTKLITVGELEHIPDPPDGRYELHHGELVKVTFPKPIHQRLQRRLLRLLEPLVANFGEVMIEMAFRALTEFELRAADVAVISWGRWNAMEDDRYLEGAPDLVIEVLSPSNSFAEIYDKPQLCLANGSKEFWIVNPKSEQVIVMTTDAPNRTYTKQDHIPLRFLGESSIPAAKIFEA